MKTIRHTTRSKDHHLKIETDLAIINIRVGLLTDDMRRVEVVSILEDSGESKTYRVVEGEES